MSGIDIATRVHDHNFRVDPYVRSLMDTDFYKLLMGAFIWKFYPDVRVSFAVKNRSVGKVRLRDVIREEDLRAQLDHVKSLRFTNTELIWLAGNSFYGKSGIFPPGFIAALRDLRLPDYTISIGEDGDYAIEFEGTWLEVTLWEIYILAILNEARSRAAMASMSRYELRVLYANATQKIVRKLKDLREAGVSRIAEFGTRRRHGFLWQDFVIEAMREELGPNFLGTSNALHAMRHDIDAIGTNAHELPMVMAALARLQYPDDDQFLLNSQFNVLAKWEQIYDGNLLVALPDTFGTTQFLRLAPSAFPEIRHWTGFREDSKDPFIGGHEKIAFWKGLGCDPREKLQLFSDGLDAAQIIALNKEFGGQIRDGYGWGTTATNDFRGCDPRGGHALDPISIVCKVKDVSLGSHGSVSAVKLSDNYEKATGSAVEIEHYRNVFGTEGVDDIPVVV